ncbi:hypothetical protein GCM10022243_43480 [Saccharothrix violaceirubra]|uniref:dTDP-4-amino-4,6-dideoxygalactose transaminase n=1 Tax=Saccharothrix violaceirubra TaxID=413306 RepID=A0A7W7T3J7_9PSEU|nr:DegT/DnrJ/EryC1/StrS family aminotransferase [Saccharothrix violaceirubra]MBB4965636.1 dTDP-4-amino-4,6-dideoxygalactose transaminase [Saccharothrix violaceirubra]
MSRSEPGHRLVGNDLGAAIGLVQLRRLPEFVTRRRAVAARYDRLLADLPGVLTPPAPHEVPLYGSDARLPAWSRWRAVIPTARHGSRSASAVCP